MLEDAGLPRDAINRLVTLRHKPGVTTEEIRQLAMDVQVKEKSLLASRAAIDTARAVAWLAICDVGSAMEKGAPDIGPNWQNAINALWAWRHRAESHSPATS